MKHLSFAGIICAGCMPPLLIESRSPAAELHTKIPAESPQENPQQQDLSSESFQHIDTQLHMMFDTQCDEYAQYTQRVTELTCAENSTEARAVCQIEVTRDHSMYGLHGPLTRVFLTIDCVRKDDVWHISVREEDR